MTAYARSWPAVGESIRARIDQGIEQLFSAPQAALLIAVGSAVVLFRGLRMALEHAFGTQERQLELFSGSDGDTHTHPRLFPVALPAGRSWKLR